MKRFICLVLAFVIFFGICGIIAPDINNIYKLKEADSFAEQVNVLVKQYESRQDTQNRLIVNSNKIKESYGAVKVIKAHGFQVMQFKDYESAESAKSSIEKLGVACDRDDFAYTQAIKKAPSTKDLWASQITQSDVTMNYLATTGKTYNDVTVAVMDTGINDAHKSFDGRLIECNKNFSSSGSMNSSSDDSGHGTSVAGVIALNTLDNVKIKPYKTFDKEGKCTNSQIVATLNYILNEKKLPDIINMSFSVQSISSSVTRDSLTRNLISKGVTIITSAGNNAVNAKFYYPANIGEVITVSSNNIGVALPSSINVKQSAAGCSKVIPLLSIAQAEPISPLTTNNTINILLFRITIKSYLFSIILLSFPQKIHCKETNKKQKPHKISIANILAYVTSITFFLQKQVLDIKVTMNIHSSLT